MSIVAPDNALFEDACGTCSVCHDEEQQIFLFDCGHWACEGCCYGVFEDGTDGCTGCDNCEPPGARVE